MKEVFANDLARFENQSITGFFVAANRQLRTTASGSGYLSMTLCDSTGQLEARMWEPEGAGEFASGDVVKIRGLVCRYQEKLQLKIDKLRRADLGDLEKPGPDANEYDLGDFLPKTSFDVEELWARLTGYVQSFTDGDLRALMQLFLSDPAISGPLRVAPAAKALHHAWIGGLLEHIVSLLDVCELAAKHYPQVHRDLLLSGAMLHYNGKLYELRTGTSFSYSVEGQLLGHITIGTGMIDEKIAALPDFPPRLRTLLLHIVLSHHGRLEFGTPKLPMTAEALLLHHLDDLEAKMQTLSSEFTRARANGAQPGEPTEYIRSMERALVDTRAYLDGSSREPS